MVLDGKKPASREPLRNEISFYPVTVTTEGKIDMLDAKARSVSYAQDTAPRLFLRGEPNQKRLM